MVSLGIGIGMELLGLGAAEAAGVCDRFLEFL
jgi:hypothetical protein